MEKIEKVLTEADVKKGTKVVISSNMIRPYDKSLDGLIGIIQDDYTSISNNIIVVTWPRNSSGHSKVGSALEQLCLYEEEIDPAEYLLKCIDFLILKLEESDGRSIINS